MPREQILAELKRLPRRELDRTLAGLLPAEREQVLAMLAPSKDAGREAPPFEALVNLSPWLLSAAARARGEEGGAGPAMTPAAREALARALESLASAQPKQSRQLPARPRAGRLGWPFPGRGPGKRR